MTVKQAHKIARRWLGSQGVAVVELRTEAPCVLAVKGEYALDVRGRGVSWAEAERDLQRRESTGVCARKRRDETREGGTMTVKQAHKIARRWLGSQGVAVVEPRTETPCVLAVKGEYALDVRGRGVSWAEAERDLQRRETVQRARRRLRLGLSV